MKILSYKLSIYEFLHNPLEESRDPLWSSSYNFNDSSPQDHIENLKNLLHTATENHSINSLSDIDIVGHRVVHGGTAFERPVFITADVKKTITNLIPLAPLHNPANLEGIDLLEKMLPNTPQVAVFDTAFHSTIPEKASTYAGPYSWKEEGIKRYGFHGISHEYCASRAALLLKFNIGRMKMVTCHLGNGCSLAAIDRGYCIDTTMGFTPLEGLMMGTRCGSIDPGILLYLENQKKQKASDLFHTLNFESGLKGISGISSDMRDIMSSASKRDRRAKLALDMYIHSLRRNMGSMINVLGGIDTLVFTAGIGENSPKIRHEACQHLSYIGLELDNEKNNSPCHEDSIISSTNSKIHVLVIHTKEDWSIACSSWKLRGLRGRYPPRTPAKGS